MAIEFLLVLIVGAFVGAMAAYGFLASRRPSFVLVVQQADGRPASVAGPYATAADAARAAELGHLAAFTVERLTARPQAAL